MSNWKEQVKEGKASGRKGPYVSPGKHVLRLDLLKEMTTRQGKDQAVAEFIVEQTNSEDLGMRVGNRVTRIWNFSDHPSAPSNYKGLLLALYGDLSEDDPPQFTPLEDGALTDEQINYATSENNPFNGALLYCDAHNITTEKNQKQFTVCNWELREYPPEDD